MRILLTRRGEVWRAELMCRFQVKLLCTEGGSSLVDICIVLQQYIVPLLVNAYPKHRFYVAKSRVHALQASRT